MLNLGWERMESVIHGEFSHAGSIKTTRNGLLFVVEHARACMTYFLKVLMFEIGDN